MHNILNFKLRFTGSDEDNCQVSFGSKYSCYSSIQNVTFLKFIFEFSKSVNQMKKLVMMVNVYRKSGFVMAKKIVQVKSLI
jgi:hypothetical protein